MAFITSLRTSNSIPASSIILRNIPTSTRFIELKSIFTRSQHCRKKILAQPFLLSGAAKGFCQYLCQVFGAKSRHVFDLMAATGARCHYDRSARLAVDLRQEWFGDFQ